MCAVGIDMWTKHRLLHFIHMTIHMLVPVSMFTAKITISHPSVMKYLIDHGDVLRVCRCASVCCRALNQWKCYFIFRVSALFFPTVLSVYRGAFCTIQFRCSRFNQRVNQIHHWRSMALFYIIYIQNIWILYSIRCVSIITFMLKFLCIFFPK